MALYAVTVVRNEAGRYLSSMLAATKEVVDEHFVYDDQSSDATFATALEAGCYVCYRDEPPSFLEHEGRFRQNAWNAFEDCCSPKTGDWILAIDADEVLVSVGTNCCVRCELDQATAAASLIGAKSVLLPLHEVWGHTPDGTPLLRVDGYWDRNRHPRLFRYERNGIFRDKAMGSGSAPTYVTEGRISQQCFGLRLMHYGYADLADQLAKHERYVKLLDHGHNDRHIQSIVGPRTLERWDGPIPTMVRGG